jgi:hypothetical protein
MPSTARNLQEVTSSQPATENLQIQSPPGPQQPIAKIVPAGLSTACAPHSLPLLQPVLLCSRRTRKSPTANCSAKSDKASLQGPDKASPGAATPSARPRLHSSLGYCLTDKASHDASLSLAYAYLILLLVRTRHLVAAHLTLHLTNTPPVLDDFTTDNPS